MKRNLQFEELVNQFDNPSVTGNDVKQNENYGMYVPWNHESYLWNFNDNIYSYSVILMSSNKTKRASVQLQINNIENQITDLIKKN